MAYTRKQVDEIIEDLKGTCRQMGEFGWNEEEMSDENWGWIDQEIFQCDGCGWWCEGPANDESGDSLCEDCAKEEE